MHPAISGLASRCSTTPGSFDIRLAVDLRIHHEVQQLDDVITQLASIDDLVDHAVVQQKLGTLKVFRQLLADSLFDDARTGEPDQRFWFGEYDVAEHRETGSDATRRRIGQY